MSKLQCYFARLAECLRLVADPESVQFGDTLKSLRQLASIFLISLSFAAIGCDTSVKRRVDESISGKSMGVSYTIKLLPGKDSPEILEIAKAVNEEIASVHHQVSAEHKGSEIQRFNQSNSTDWFAVSRPSAALIQLALDYHRLSDGALDVTAAPLIKLWSVGNDMPPAAPTQADIDELLKSVGSEKLTVRLDPPALKKQIPELQIDPLPIRSGHIVDRISQKLESLNVANYSVAIGGCIRTKGTRSDGADWQVGIERPDVNNNSLHDVVGLPSGSLVSATGNGTSQEKESSPLIDPKTGRPVQSDILSATVVMADCAAAEATAVALVVMGFDRAIQVTERQKLATLLVAGRDGKLETVSSAEFERLTTRNHNSVKP